MCIFALPHDASVNINIIEIQTMLRWMHKRLLLFFSIFCLLIHTYDAITVRNYNIVIVVLSNVYNMQNRTRHVPHKPFRSSNDNFGNSKISKMSSDLKRYANLQRFWIRSNRTQLYVHNAFLSSPVEMCDFSQSGCGFYYMCIFLIISQTTMTLFVGKTRRYFVFWVRIFIYDRFRDKKNKRLSFVEVVMRNLSVLVVL